MARFLSRRSVLVAAGASVVAAPFIVRPSLAQGQGLLAKLQAQGSARIGIAGNRPWAWVEPDGSLGGLAPALCKAICAQFGITKFEGTVATFGQLIPGMNAGRWDFVGDALNITPERCTQAIYADPYYRKDETQWMAYLKADLPDPPKTYSELGRRLERVGTNQGSAEIPPIQRAIEAGIKGTLIQFPDADLAFSGVQQKRVQAYLADRATMEFQQKRYPGIDIAPIDSEHPNRGTAAAFRPGDRDLRDAFNNGFRALKKSGEVAKILGQYGFTYDAAFMEVSGDDMCKL